MMNNNLQQLPFMQKEQHNKTMMINHLHPQPNPQIIDKSSNKWSPAISITCSKYSFTRVVENLQIIHFCWTPFIEPRKLHDSAACKQQNHFLGWDFPRTEPFLYVGSSFAGESGMPPVFFSFLALLKITVNPSADAGSLTSHSPNFGNGLLLPFSCRINKLKDGSHFMAI